MKHTLPFYGRAATAQSTVGGCRRMTLARTQEGVFIDSPHLAAAPDAFTARNGFLYGLLGLLLAFAALPLYVILPNYYAREFGMSLGLLGAIKSGAVCRAVGRMRRPAGQRLRGRKTRARHAAILQRHRRRRTGPGRR